MQAGFKLKKKQGSKTTLNLSYKDIGSVKQSGKKLIFATDEIKFNPTSAFNNVTPNLRQKSMKN